MFSDELVAVLQGRSHRADQAGSWNDMPAKIVAHPSIADRRAKGADARIATPPASHTGWVPAGGREDPVTLLSDQNLTREQDLVPVRHGRMMVSPFTFYRGAAKIMGADLKDRSGIQSPLRSTWARAMRSTQRSPTSPRGTRIRTSGTISSS